jgi:Domain of unknown function (DUF4157)
MSFQRIHQARSQNPQISSSSSQFAPRPFLGREPQRPPTQEDLANEAFQQNKFEVSGLQLKQEKGTITPVEQERLDVLQAKRDEFSAQPMERAKAQPNLLEILIRNSQATQTPESPALAQTNAIAAKSATTGDRPDSSGEQQINQTGMPAALKAGVESRSGYSLNNVRVHYNSPQPARLEALAYTQGTEIHVAPGQEQHLPHEAWHVVQQMQGRVQQTTQLHGVPVNDDARLEHEADVMGAQAIVPVQPQRTPDFISTQIIQRVRKTNLELLDLTVKAFDDHRKSEQMDWANTPGFTEAQRHIIWHMIDWGVSGLARIKLDDVVQAIEADPISQDYLKEYCTAVNGGETVQLEAVADLPTALKQGKWVDQLNKTVGGPRVKATIPADKFKDLIADETVADAFIDYYTNQNPILQTKDGREVWAFCKLVGEEKANINDYTGTLPAIRNYHKFKKAALDKLVADLTAARTTPLMLVLYSMFDHNGAFHRHEEMHKVITDTHNRVFLLEDMNPNLVLKLKEDGFDQLARAYGMEGKITQAVLAGHGDTHSVELAGEDTQMVGEEVRMDGYYPATFDPDNPNATMWAEFFEALFRNMETKGGFSSKLLLRACLTNSNEVDLPKLTEFMRTEGIIDLDAVADTKTPEHQASIRAGIKQYIAKYGSIATKMQTLAGGRATVLGANASITAASTGSIKPSGELSIIALTDPAVDKSKLEYVQSGTEPVGAIKAVIESWAHDPIECFAKMDLRIAAPVATNDDFVIHLLYGTIKANYANDILAANAFTRSAHALSSVVKGSTECRVSALTSDAMIQKHAVAFYAALLGHAPIAAVARAKLVIYQAWLLKDDAKQTAVADTLGQVNFDRNKAKDYVDIAAIASKIPAILADGTASQRGRDLLALIGFIANNNLDCKNYLVAQATEVGKPLPQRLKDELKGYDEKRLRLGLGLPEEIVPVLPPPLPLGGGPPPPVLHQPNVRTSGGINDYFVEPLPTGVKKITKTSVFDWAHVRQEPKATGTEIARYDLSRDFSIVGEVKSDAGVSLGWYMIKLANGQVAYIETKYF